MDQPSLADLRCNAATGTQDALWALSQALVQDTVAAVVAGSRELGENTAQLAEAMHLCRQAAEAGQTDAQARLGLALVTAGFGETRALREGYAWLWRATRNDGVLSRAGAVLLMPFVPLVVPLLNRFVRDAFGKTVYRKR